MVLYKVKTLDSKTLNFMHKILEKYKLHFILISVVILNNNVYSQNKEYLIEKPFTELIDSFYSVDKSSDRQLFIEAFIAKAKRESDSIKLSSGYYLAATNVERSKMLVYIDSSIIIGEKKPTNYQPVAAYLLKAGYYRSEFNYKKSLDNIALAKKYEREYPNKDFLRQINTFFGVVKISIGNHEDALQIFRKEYNQSKKDTLNGFFNNYLDDVYNLASVFNEQKIIDSAMYYNNLGLHLSQRIKEKRYNQYFKYNLAISNYHKKEYDLALNSLNKATTFFKEINDKPNEIESRYYTGQIYMARKQYKEAYIIFNQIDSLYKNKKNFYLKFRDIYYQMINISRELGEPYKQIDYTNRLIKLDSLFILNNLYLNKKISSEFNLPKLTEEKDALIEELNNENTTKRNINVILIVIISLLLILTFFYVWKYKNFNRTKNFRSLNVKISNDYNGKALKKDLIISDKTKAKVLDGLMKFEEEKGFLQPDLTLHKLAEIIHTNSKYLSKIINTHKSKTFSDYINKLRIDYTVDRLKVDLKFRHYTVKAIALESGFNNSESFSNSFEKYIGVKPSFYLKQY